MIPYILTHPFILLFNFTRILSYFQKLLLSDWNHLSDGLKSKRLELSFSVKGRSVICSRSSNTFRPLKLMSDTALVPFSFPVLQSHFISATQDKRKEYPKLFLKKIIQFEIFPAHMKDFCFPPPLSKQSFRLVKSVTNRVKERCSLC